MPFPPGGGTDLSARLIVPYIEKYIGGGAKIVVINKGGAGGDIGAAEIALQAGWLHDRLHERAQHDDEVP